MRLSRTAIRLAARWVNRTYGVRARDRKDPETEMYKLVLPNIDPELEDEITSSLVRAGFHDIVVSVKR